MRLPRMTTRRWMVTVAGLAIVMAAARLALVAWSRYDTAYSHTLLADTLRMNGEVLRAAGAQAKTASLRQSHSEALARHVVWADYFSALADKYRSASRRPWMAMEPDLPPPN